MRRNGFTMVELIFVIVIIGILSVAAIPKFTNVKDQAKISTEVGALGSLDAAIVSEKEYYDGDVRWHKVDIQNGSGKLNARYESNEDYNTKVNKAKKVLSLILKKTDSYKIVGAASTNGSDIVSYSDTTNPSNDILFIKGPASDAVKGVKIPLDAAGQDIAGKPDKNDLWVFNPNDFDINITSSATYPLHNSPTIVSANSVALLDFNGTSQIAPGGKSQNMRDLTVIRSDTTAKVINNDVLEIRN